MPVKTRDDLSAAYTPGVAEPCREIAKDPAAAYTYTAKGNLVAVVTNGTAVLGLGDIGAAAAMPVMEGKAILFKEFGGVDAFPICLDTKDPEQVIEAVRLLAPTFGGVNLEDISSPNCFYIEETLEKELDIPVFHDDQHGTAIVVTAALLGALRVVKKEIGAIRVVVNGPGAAGTAIIKMLLAAGVRDVIACDENGILYKERGVGIGGTFDRVALLAKRALLRPLGSRHPDPYYAAMEQELLEKINELGTGPQGFGGRTTALGLQIETFPTHIAGLPVAVNINCHVTRHAEVVL